ncbi:acetyl-CoA carboxylase biotin carboxyl carrier protein [Floccifex sp.]|uniref:acetyl-CoA carboxylase biotin carboxyl carrier protein n=1 Tax=Floccifex sp. TaxID=2815810 RepID=UPI003EFC7ACC
MDTEKIKEIISIFENSKISSMDLEEGSFKIRLEKKDNITVSHEHVAKEETKQEQKQKQTLNSPLVGTFYASLKPGQESLVKVGQQIKKGDVLCIIEAMKSMNEMKAQKDGVIQEILVEDGQMVEYDQPLFVLGD